MNDPALIIKNKTHVNVAGIIPVAAQPLDFDFPWHDSLIPIGHNYLAIEKAVFDCALAGCNTIWIVCPRDMQPLIRYRLGDWVNDPVRYEKGHKFGKRPLVYEIPIYYAPLHSKDMDRRDCLAWSIITGAQYAWHVSKKISRYTFPDKYFVAFPYGMFSSYWLKDYRTQIRNTDYNFYLECDNANFKVGSYLPFTFFPDDFIRCRKFFRKHETKGYDSEGKSLRAQEKWSGRWFTHDFIFDNVDITNAHIGHVPWYYDVSSWEKLKTWLKSEEKLDKPKDFLLSYNEWNPLAVDVAEPQKK
jgi:hypothetical protein